MMQVYLIEILVLKNIKLMKIKINLIGLIQFFQ